ncbi:hypothetical protein [Flavobacterium sp.]|uniref:hypothetical protein n=1 Tax=Flavobacterium sp. TaxID=239 RepID=UPI003D13543D
MKKFVIKKKDPYNWIVSHNEFPKFSCIFENKKLSFSKKIKGLNDPTGDAKEVSLLQPVGYLAHTLPKG